MTQNVDVMSKLLVRHILLTIIVVNVSTKILTYCSFKAANFLRCDVLLLFSQNLWPESFERTRICLRSINSQQGMNNYVRNNEMDRHVTQIRSPEYI